MMSVDFLNQSTQITLWNTAQAELEFTGGRHLFSLAGEDYGAALAGYNNNFAWARLTLDVGASLTLLDGVATSLGASFYTKLFDLQEGIAQLQSTTRNFNIYYDASLIGNQYLQGLNYSFGSGSGWLIAVGAFNRQKRAWLKPR